MIGRLSGILLEKNPPQVLLDVHGIGYELDVPTVVRPAEEAAIAAALTD